MTATGGIAAQVQVVEHLGGESYLYLQASSGEALVLKVNGESKAVPNQQVQIAPDRNFLHLFDAIGQRIP